LEKANIRVSAVQFRQLATYFELLRKWNRRVNLTSLQLDDYGDRTLDRLLVEPLVAATLVPDARRCIDVGSGGGSPGIPMKIVLPNVRLLMVEARERKSAFLREATRILALPATDVITARAENVPMTYAGADVVSARGVRLDEKLINSIRRLLDPDGRLLTFGGRDMLLGFRVLAEKVAAPNIVIRAWRLADD
jgi:16S rRNA (guanine527-N7)-methyltransferase